MKFVATLVKILTALAAIAGVIYAVATYGDKIVAWAKKLLGCTCECEGEGECTCECEGECACECEAECACEEAAKEAPAEEVPAEEPAAEEAVVAEEADFEG